MDVRMIIEDHGHVFRRATPLPVGMRRGKMGNCYQNATKEMMKHGDAYEYCEGLVSHRDGHEKLMHGWLYRKSDFATIDTTWKLNPALVYRGLWIPGDVIIEMAQLTGRFGILENLPLEHADRLMTRILEHHHAFEMKGSILEQFPGDYVA